MTAVKGRSTSPFSYLVSGDPGSQLKVRVFRGLAACRSLASLMGVGWTDSVAEHEGRVDHHRR
jgi:hypothetical protein